MKINLTIGIGLLLVCCALPALSQIQKQEYKRNLEVKAEQWQVVDISFKGKPIGNANPFEVEFGAIYSGPDGQSLKVPGFYDGENKWIARFSSMTPGTWTFETYASKPELSGQKGKIMISTNTRENQQGAVILDPENPQAFIYEDGSPHFMLAFELDWLFALDYDNPDAMPKTEQILKHVQENGFNHVVMNLYAYDVGWGIAKDVPEEYFYGRPDYTPFLGDNDNPDFSRLNLKLFQHLDRVFASMQAKGLDAHLMIYVWNKKVNWPDMYSKADNQYFDYIIDRYQAFSNMIWDVSKEALDYGRCDIPYINERISRIRQRDAFKRLVTVHDYEYNSRESQRVDFISIQSWRSNLYSLMLQGREIHSDKPVVNIEHGGYEEGPYRSFEGNYTHAETCLERTYECVFAGVYGSYYWQNTSWNIVIHDPFDEKHEFDAPRFDYYKHLAGLFERYDFNSLRPSFPKLTTNDKGGQDNLATNGFALHNGKDLYLMMIPSESDRVNIVIPKPESGKLNITWFNPFTGEYQEEGERAWSSWAEVVNPWKNKTGVLIIKSL
ncbi:DUF5060 domain-containing protein [Pararhodonellum marinum]|uniref:DUF5060 domain-containing protein n=1 Tax=Pararhodonellum marinum TaxID=2755358 RepID=UPI00189097B3|nr:DUF5060 domain-containing protein [Pararhodonellum marinum]